MRIAAVAAIAGLVTAVVTVAVLAPPVKLIHIRPNKGFARRSQSIQLNL